MFKTYDLFTFRDIEDLVGDMMYYYLFQGLGVQAIEKELLKTEEYRGWLSKALLNYYGIDTNGENRGIYEGRTISEVVQELYRSSNVKHIHVAKILKRKFL